MSDSVSENKIAKLTPFVFKTSASSDDKTIKNKPLIASKSSEYGHDITSPHHLSWLCLLEYNNNHLLTSEEELYQYYHSVTTHGSSPLPTLSSQLQHHLRRCLGEDPILGSSVISHLLVTSDCTQSKKNNEILNGLYILTVNDVLDSIEHAKEEDLGKLPERRNKIYRLLSLYNPDQYHNYEILRSLFARVFELMSLQENFLSKTHVLSSLIGRNQDYLVQQFCSYEFEIETRRLPLSQGIRTGDLRDDQQTLLLLSSETDRSQQLHHFFVHCLKQKQHLLSAVVETSLSLIRNQMFRELGQLLSVSDLCPLRPLVLLLGWSVCRSVNDACRLLKVLWDEGWCCIDPMVESGCSKLAYQIDLIQWCLEKTKPLLSPLDSTAQTHQQRAAVMFHFLENHSVLYVLHQSTRIGALDQGEVLKLLRKSPQSEKQEEKKPKSVRFAVDGEQKDPSCDIHIEQHRDISIFSGYCAIKLVMEAIYYCAENTNDSLMNPVQRRYRYSTKRRNSVSSKSKSSSGSFNGDNFQEEYKKNIIEKLKLAKEYLSRLQPLTYRVEVLENLFSLLFATHENIQDTVCDVESDSGDLEPDEEEKSRSDTVGVNDQTMSTVLEDSLSPTSPIKMDLTEKCSVESSSTSIFAYDEPFPEPVDVPKSRKRSTSLTEYLVSQKRETAQMSRLNQIKSEETLQRGSGNGSALSGDSTCSYLKFGLLCNEYLIRDILTMIKDCMTDLNIARIQVKGQKTDRTVSKHNNKESVPLIDVSLEDQLTDLVVSSVTKDTIGKRVSQLSHHVNEAFWRFQLVCHKKISITPGEVVTEPIIVYIEEEEEGTTKIFCTSEETGNGRKTPFSLTSRSNSRSSPSLDNESVTDSSKSEGHRKKRSRSRSQRRHSNTQNSSKHMGIVSNMLASAESLLCMCIRKNSLMQAAEVIKLLRLENKPEAVEVKFAEVYNRCAKKLQGLHTSNQGNLGKSAKPGKMTLKALGNVAAAGVANVSITGIAEELLNDVELPKIHTGRSLCISKLMTSTDFDNVPSIILFDLLCTSCKTWELCNNMIDILKSKLSEGNRKVSFSSTEQAEELKQKQDHKIRGVRDFIVVFESLMQLSSESFSGTPALEHREVYGLLYKHSVSTFLQTANLPLSQTECISYATLITEVKRAMEKVEHTFQLHGRMPLEGYVNRSPPKMSPRASPKTSPRGEDPSQMNQPVLHTAMKQLILVMQRDLPSGGICSLLSRNASSSGPSVNREYLQSLYDHLKRLAFVVMESEGRSKETMVVPKNYFRMLDEGPISILGRLMFSLKLYPAKLEAVAKGLSLNLTHIIVHSCCTKVPSKHRDVAPRHDLLQAENSIGDGPTVKTVHVQTERSELSVHPEKYVRHILTKLIHLMRELASKNSTKMIFDVTCAKLLLKMKAVHEVLGLVPALKHCDLDLLKTKEEKLCFFGNLQNLMFIHMCLDLIWRSMPESFKEDNVIDKCPETKLYSEMSTLQQVLQLRLFVYDVGQLGKISLFDVKYIMNHSGLPPPTEFDGILSSRIYEVPADDTWTKFIPKTEPCLLFLLTTCAQSSPPVQVLVPELIKTKIQQAMKDYLDHNVVVDVQKNTVTLPELLMSYKNDFSTEMEDFSAENEGILRVVLENTSGDLHTSLEAMLRLDESSNQPENISEELLDYSKYTSGRRELPFRLEIEPNKQDFMITFGYDQAGQKSGLKKAHRRVTSLPKNLHLSSSHSSTQEENETLYQLTPFTLEYVKTESPLVATLVSLVCTDELDEIEEHLTDDYFSDSIRSRSSSEMSLVDIRSYRYQKLTDDYPVLKQHIVTYVIPIAGAEDPEILKSGDLLLKFITSNISEKVKACMLNLHDSQQFQNVLMRMLNDLLNQKKWTQIIDVLESLPNVVLAAQAELCVLHDFVIMCFIHEKIKKTPLLSKRVSEQVLKYLQRILSKDIKFHSLLLCHRHLLLEQNLTLFEICCFDSMSEEMLSIIRKKLAEMKMYYRITACAKTLQVKLSARRDSFILGEERGEDYLTVLDLFMDWRNLLTSSIVSHNEVLSVLLRTGDYRTARIWCKHVDLPSKQYLNVIEHQLINLLEEQPSNTTKAFLVLEEIKMAEGKDCVHVCEILLEKVTNQNDVLFILNYMLEQLQTLLQESKVDELTLMQIGVRMLLCLPSFLHQEYRHLSTSPRLILEQLMMNMKVDLAGKAYHMVHMDLTTLRNVEQRFIQSDFNKLVCVYAKNALDLSGIVMEEKSRSQSEVSNSSSDKATDRGTPDPNQSFTDHTRTPKRLSLTESVRLKPNTEYTGGRFLPTPTPSPIPEPSSLRSERGTSTFMMPAEPPSKDKWQPDASTHVCMVCKVEKFSMFNRRHHCRRCGRVVCASCSTKTSLIHGVLARTCDDCYSQIYNLSKTETDVYRTFIGGDSMSVASVSSRVFSPSPGVHSMLNDGSSVKIPYVNSAHFVWKLKADTSEHNEITREEFYYEQAPSTSLCLSILGLHSNQVTSGQLMLNLCDSLSQYLRPLAPGVPNPEVDYSLILSMMKTLLFHAKMRFSASGESQGLAQSEVYQSHIDLLAVLMDDNYSDLPSLQELTKKDVIMLRDRLIQDERFQLASEVSTKCGLDTAGVWGAWGMNCLMAGDFPGAREKYARCLKPQQDKNQVTSMSKPLRDIIDYLEMMPAAGPSQLHLLMTKKLTWQDLLATHVSVSEDCLSDSLQFQECLFYLKTYGAYSHVIDFHRRNGRWMKAVQFLLDKRCTSEVYMESLLIPALSNGELLKLTDQMVMIDPTLEKWHLYLTATCRHLLKYKYHNMLYEFQLFMKDFIRAAMTCITCFYQKGAQSYLDLNYRVNHLHNAMSHMQAFMDPKQWGSVIPTHVVAPSSDEWKKRTEGSVRLVMSKEEVAKYSCSISLQIEVTKFLSSCLTHTEADATAVATRYVGADRSTQLPTLFGSSKMRTDLVTMVLLSGNDINVAFELAFKIIKEYRLGSGTIFTHVAREMAKHQRYHHVRQLLDCVRRVGLGDDDTMDEILGACILVIADKPSELKEAENFIKLLRKDSNKINAYILCGKLRSAYLMAVKAERVEDVQRIAGAAQRMGQTAVRTICNKWLEQRKSEQS
ncbi:hypothetical protein FSP39_017239 [Pinctada imbricata]|uniref:FYVE-type domain-containing protein n=1 Tax=Pinctada imbricata TaxID=66713 RepID=A0AA88XX20_PINIB|nr:hypothetical protein FSP39_017239 [Pinctada imbricata]